MTIALFLGRFQPFHNAHLEVVKKILKEHSFVKIAIGSSQYSNTKDNPFSAEERSDMIHAAIERADLTQFETTLVPDIHSDPDYVAHVEKLVGKFDVVYACDNKNTEKLFKAVGYKVVTMNRIDDISSTKIRNYIIKDSDKWEKLVPESVVKIMKKMKAEKRIKSFSK